MASVQFHELDGQPLGVGNAVPNFYRLAALINELAVRCLYIVQDHFVDYFLVEPSYSAHNAAASFCDLCAAGGVELDHEPTQQASATATSFGVVFELRLIIDGKVVVAPKPERIDNLTAVIDDLRTISSRRAMRLVSSARRSPSRSRSSVRLDFRASRPSGRASTRSVAARSFKHTSPSRCVGLSICCAKALPVPWASTAAEARLLFCTPTAGQSRATNGSHRQPAAVIGEHARELRVGAVSWYLVSCRALLGRRAPRLELVAEQAASLACEAVRGSGAYRRLGFARRRLKHSQLRRQQLRPVSVRQRLLAQRRWRGERPGLLVSMHEVAMRVRLRRVEFAANIADRPSLNAFALMTPQKSSLQAATK